LGDGGFVVPTQGPILGTVLGRDPGGQGVLKRNATCIGVTIENSDDVSADDLQDFFPENAGKLINALMKTFTGVQVPPKLTKLFRNCARAPNGQVHDIFGLMLDSRLYDMAYQSIKSNPGNMTPGSDGTTFEGWDREKVKKIIDAMRDGTFRFTKSRLVLIPRPDGKKRPLKIAPPKDKVVQRIITWILEAIYEPSFHPESFGFRYGRGCHDALHHVKTSFNSARFLIEGDISKCFDEIDHDLLIGILRRRIKDERFIVLILHALQAGYLDEFKIPKDSIVGTPQGSIVSPILSNIFLSEFDWFVENTLKKKYNRGKARAQPNEYKTQVSLAAYNMKRYKATKDLKYLREARLNRKIISLLPSVVLNDPEFRRLVFVRYADDWIIGFAGPYEEALEIRDLCAEFFTSIKLRLNLIKTAVTKASLGAIFLGCKIHIPVNQQALRKKKKANSALRRASLGVRINAPILRIFKKLNASSICLPDGFPIPRMSLYALPPKEIVALYTSIFRGICNYYSPADNYKRMSASIWYILRASCCKVLAAKLKLSTVRQVLLRFGKYLSREDLPGFPSCYGASGLNIRGKLFKFGKSLSRVSALTQIAGSSIKVGQLTCCICLSCNNVQMHHIRHLKDANKITDLISRVMSARKRKQIPLCSHCHVNKHVMINRIRKGLDSV
jgi:group II intron reverse transcriptase/maturase